MEISFSDLSTDLLSLIRQKHSFAQMDKKYKLGKNQYSRWEKGTIPIKWEDFVRLAKSAQLPIKEALEAATGYKGNPFHYNAIIAISTGQSTYKLIGKSLGVSRFVVNRWMQGKSSPTLKQMLEIIHIGTTRLATFINQFTNSAELPSFKAYSKRLDDTLQLIQEKPWMSGILSIINLEDYKKTAKHDDHWVAKKMGLTTASVRSTFTALERFGLVQWSGHHYTETPLGGFDPSVLKAKAKEQLLFWFDSNMKSVRANYPSPTRRSLSSYQVFNVNSEAAQNIKNLYIEFLKNVSMQIKEGEAHSTEAYCFVMSMVNFDDMVSLDK